MTTSKQSGKKKQVESMFNDIAPRYDFLNHFLSMGIDTLWRTAVRKLVASTQAVEILDVATGTGDLAIELSKIEGCRITGIDIAQEMLEVGKKKLARKKLDHRIHLQHGDSEHLQFKDHTFDAVTVAFGVRNFENLQQGLSEMKRVLKPSGLVAILEFSKPKSFPVKTIYNFYFNFILPGFGKLISKHHSAYTYLPESVKIFPEDAAFIQEMEKAGFTSIGQKRLSFGIATLYYGNS